ncbi:MAG: hypothetical protein ACI85U_003951, partial [Candidatus Promineifilaceae bacterium]
RWEFEGIKYALAYLSFVLFVLVFPLGVNADTRYSSFSHSTNKRVIPALPSARKILIFRINHISSFVKVCDSFIAPMVPVVKCE